MKKKTEKKLKRNIVLLKSKLKKLEKVNQKDSLTGILNRRAMLEILEGKKFSFQQKNQDDVIIFADLDRFKQINDSFGHACGDYVIVKIAKFLKENVRSHDYVARWGGEEFLIVLTQSSLNDSLNCLRQLQEKLSQEKFIWQGNYLSITITFGVAIHSYKQKLEKTIEKADEALYQGKLQGRNRIQVYQDLTNLEFRMKNLE